MLKSLSVKNYALIDKLEISFENGLSTITGETGAGKSILLGALSLILGNRAELSVLKNKDEKCVIEGIFDIKELKLQNFFKENLEEVDYDHETILRRIITPSGKSRAFINDTPVNLAGLKELGYRLIDIHSQHKNLLLTDNSFQLNVIDSVAKNFDLLNEYKKEFSSYKKLEKELKHLIEKSEAERKDADYYQHRFEQLNALNLQENEQDVLEKELETINNSEEIKINLSGSYDLLNGEDSSVISNLNIVKENLSKISEFLNEDLSGRVESCIIELQDISSEVEVQAQNVEFSPERLNFINERLNEIYSLQQTHRVSTVNELLEIQSDLEKRLDEIQNFDFEIEELTKKAKAQNENVNKIAQQLSGKRKKAAPEIEKTILKQLSGLGMPNAEFKIKIEKETDFALSGIDKISYLFSANKAGNLNNIVKVASGGEIARVMISIKALVSENMSLPTIIFDEIDTGVSGDIADKMGNIMQKMARNMQVFSITHLPQIAAKGKNQFLVYKKDTEDSTVSNIKRLSEQDRIKEIAKMLSGKKLSEAAIENAKTLLKNA